MWHDLFAQRDEYNAGGNKIILALVVEGMSHWLVADH